MELWPDKFPRMATVLPPLESGEVRVEHLDDGIAALYVGERLWMSDTPTERADHAAALAHAHGHVLVAGLGLGMFALAAALKPNVESVTVVEIDPDTIAAVQHHLLKHAPLDVVRGDVFRFEPPRTYDFVWIDIWVDIHLFNLIEMSRLRHRLRRCTPDDNPDRIQCWGERKLLEREYLPDSQDHTHRRAPYYFLAKRITTSGFDVVVHDPGASSERVYWSGNGHHGTCTVKPARGDLWRLSVREEDEVSTQR